MQKYMTNIVYPLSCTSQQKSIHIFSPKNPYLGGQLLLILFLLYDFLSFYGYDKPLEFASTFRFPYFLPCFTISILAMGSCIACIWLPVRMKHLVLYDSLLQKYNLLGPFKIH